MIEIPPFPDLPELNIPELVLPAWPVMPALDINQGFKGDPGDTGPQGLPGVKGDTGLQGPIGITGPQGVQGVQGPIGLTGPQGVPGAQGNPGIQGPQGVQGIKGDTGFQGIPGVKGDTGLTGAQGIQGIPGVKGDTGLTGAQGIQGIPGVKGDTGLTGPAGVVTVVSPAQINAAPTLTTAVEYTVPTTYTVTVSGIIMVVFNIQMSVMSFNGKCEGKIKINGAEKVRQATTLINDYAQMQVIFIGPVNVNDIISFTVTQSRGSNTAATLFANITVLDT